MKPDYKGAWIAVYSRLLDSGDFLSLSCAERSVFFQSLLLAARTEHDLRFHNRTYHLQPGQFVTTLPELSKQCGKDCSVKIVRRTVDKLRACKTWADGRADGRADAPRLITWLNWSLYQLPYGDRADGRADGRAGLGQTEGTQTLSATDEKNSNTVVTSFDTQTRSLEDIVPLEKIVVRKEPKDLTPAYEVLEYLNLKANHSYEMKPNSVFHILALLRQGATVQQLKLIIDYKVDEWNKPDFRKNLNNATLFRVKMFSTYLEDAKKWQERQQQIADPFNMEDIDEPKPPKSPEELQKMKEDVKNEIGKSNIEEEWVSPPRFMRDS